MNATMGGSAAGALRLRLRFESDWQVGEGAGRVGSIDRIARRDPASGLPYVPAKTLTGILRDAAEQAARALDDGAGAGPWQDFCARLFGQQSKGVDDPGITTVAALRIGPAQMDPALAQALQQPACRPLAAALVFVKPGVAIDRATGMARERMLRMEEVVMAGAELQAEVELDAALPPPVRAAAQALLAAACRLADRLGAKRRRGTGRCTLTLQDAAGKALAADFSPLEADPPHWPAVAPATPVLTPADAGPVASDGPPAGLLLRLELLGPVVVPQATLGNAVTTRDHIPGSLLLPALDPLLRAALGESARHLTRWLAQGRLRIGHAWPWSDGQRLLPAPLALAAEKEASERLWCELFDLPADAPQRKPLRAGYLPPDGLPAADGSPVVRPSTVMATHATIDDASQRPTAAVGGVYSYEAVAPGQTLAATLVWDAALPLDAQSIRQRLDGAVLRIGRSKKDDYGRARVRVGPLPPSPTTASPGERHTLWLTAPLLARDERLRPVADADGFLRWLNRELGTRLELEQARLRLQRDEGWQSAWREPRATRFALAAGSCFVLRGALDERARQRLAAGLGERRGEGFGEVLLDAALLASAQPPRTTAPEAPAAAAGSSPAPVPPSDFTRALLARAWRRLVRQQALVQAQQIARELGWTGQKPPSSQLGALVAQLQFWDGRRFRDWWAHLKKTPNRIDKWPTASRQALDALADDPVASLLQRVQPPGGWPMLPGQDLPALQRGLLPSLVPVYWLTVIGAELDRRALAERGPAANEQTSRTGA